MKTVLSLLCAGRGKRMENLTDDKPKALVHVHDRPIVEHTSEAFTQTWPESRLILLSGYRSDKMKDWLAGQSFDADVVFNTEWNSFGPIFSCQTAINAVEQAESLMLGNGDTLFSKEIFEKIESSAQEAGFYLVGSRVHDASADDMLVEIEQGKVLKAEKRKAGTIDSEFESAGLLLAHGSAYVELLKKAFDQMAEAIRTGASSDGPWHGIVGKLVAEGQSIAFIDVPEKSWWEFDTQQCIEKAEASIV